MYMYNVRAILYVLAQVCYGRVETHNICVLQVVLATDRGTKKQYACKSVK